MKGRRLQKRISELVMAWIGWVVCLAADPPGISSLPTSDLKPTNIQSFPPFTLLTNSLISSLSSLASFPPSFHSHISHLFCSSRHIKTAWLVCSKICWAKITSEPKVCFCEARSCLTTKSDLELCQDFLF